MGAVPVLSGSRITPVHWTWHGARFAQTLSHDPAGGAFVPVRLQYMGLPLLYRNQCTPLSHHAILQPGSLAHIFRWHSWPFHIYMPLQTANCLGHPDTMIASSGSRNTLGAPPLLPGPYGGGARHTGPPMEYTGGGGFCVGGAGPDAIAMPP